MQNMAMPRSEQVALIDAKVDSADYTAAKLHLYENNVTPSPDSVLGDFTPATFSGYAAKTITWSPGYLDGDLDAMSSGGEHIFTKSGATPGQVYGGYITNTAGNKLLCAFRLADAPHPMENDGDVLILTLKVGILIGLLALAAEAS